MIDRQRLLADLQKLLQRLEADLLERSESADVPEVGDALRSKYEEAKAKDRTAQNYGDWRSDAITQAAAAWVLSCVFVRFLEDNGLIDPPKIAGAGARLQGARDEHELYFRAHPKETDRDYLLAVFDELAKLRATKDVFGAHNPVRDLPNWLSGDAAGELLRFFQKIDADTGLLVHDFSDPGWDTRFLGDLYQDLSEAARKKYALLQTPEFVEEFILDHTLDPAIEEFGLAKPGYETRLQPDGRLHPDDRFKMIDPACGSGHFLLGSFARLVERWRKKEPGTKIALLVQRALDSVDGVDLNPYAIAIARFRLLLAALKECGVGQLSDAPGFAVDLACGDSLLHGAPGGDQLSLGWSSIDHVYQPEDRKALERILCPKSYHAVVANPPYVTPKDRGLNQAYRDRYAACHRQYSLAVPFLERIVSLAVEGGFTGQITANSFMKREFGKKLIEEFFPRIDLTHVIDTGGAYIPGHGTPTVILFARNRKPQTSTLRAVMGVRGEPSTPEDPSKGLFWSAIVAQIGQPGSQSEFVSVGDSPRALFHKHPWSIGGGGAAELKEQLDEQSTLSLGRVATEIGFVCITKADELFAQPRETFLRACLEPKHLRPFGIGEDVRDWSVNIAKSVIFPYDASIATVKLDFIPLIMRFMWPYRTELGNRIVFGGRTYFEAGKPWYEYGQIPIERAKLPLSIVFAFVATHNHFALDRVGNVFKQSAPVIKLPPGATEEDHLVLLGVLNSSTACFWMKQTFQTKGSSGIGRGVYDEKWESFFEHTSAGLHPFPLPDQRPILLTRELDKVSHDHQTYLPANVVRSRLPTPAILAVARSNAEATRQRMIALQEELDWECYRLYGLIDQDLTYGSDAPSIRLGQRPFEMVMWRECLGGTLTTSWFERHSSTPSLEPQSEWPADYRELVNRRIEVIATNASIALIERPEYKRRWNSEPWESQLECALREWLLDRLESYFDFDSRMNEEGESTTRLAIALTTVGKLADVSRQDPEFMQVGELYRDDILFDVSRLVAELVEAESVPLLPVLRYRPSGLRKREEWEKTWALQRQEDAIDARTKLPKNHPEHLSELDAKELKKKQISEIPVPPKYASADFLKSDYWRLRGKLDVPKERWVSFPHCEGPDGTLVITWAGYDHLQLARSISAYYVDVQDRLGGRDDSRLVPLLAGLVELLPWLKQWHNEPDAAFDGMRMGDYFEGFVNEEARQLGLTIPEIKAWTPPQRVAKRGGRAKK